nr:MAG TPA: hypothetical protein [Crassvirales sp.]
MAKKKIIRKSNRTLNLFADGGTMSSTSGSSGGGNSFAQYIPAIGSTVGSVLSQVPNVNKGSSAIEEAVYGNSKQDPIQRFIGDVTGSSTKGVIDELNKRESLSASNNDELMSTWNTLDFQNTMQTEKGLVGKTLLGTALGAPWLDYQNGKVKFSGDNLLASAQGAAQGSAFGPWGALIGGIAGGVLNLGSRLGRNKRIRKINKAIEERNAHLQDSFSNLSSNIDKQNDFGTMASYAAYGGPLNIFGGGAIDYELAKEDLYNKQLSAMSKYKMSSMPNSFETPELAIFAKGGKIHIKKANRGKFTDYCGGKVTSECIARGKRSKSAAVRKRATFAANARKKWHHALGGYLYDEGGNLYTSVPNIGQHGGDFSNGVTIIGNGGTHEQNPFEGVPMGIAPDGAPNLVEQGEVKFNDYVFSNRLFATGGLLAAHNLPTTYADHSFADIAEKLSRESSERPNDPISKRGLMSAMTRLQQAQEQLRAEEQNRKYAKGGHLFAGGGPAGINPDLYDEEDNYLIVPTGSKITGNPFVYDDAGYQAPVVTSNGDTLPNTSSRQGRGASWLRYAPAVGAGLGVLTDALGWTNSPDYSNADLVGSAVDNLTDIEFTPIGNYLTYRPLDRNYYINKLNAEAGATRRAIVNQSGGNRATAIAGLLAADYNTLGRMGDLARQAEEYNMAQRERVEAFNRGTNQFNSEMGLKAAIAKQANDKLRLQARTAQAQLRDQADARSSAGRAANLTNLFDSLGDIGREEFSRNMIQTNPALYYSIDSSGRISYKNGYEDLSEAEKKVVRDAANKDKKKKKAKGGYLTMRGGK